MSNVTPDRKNFACNGINNLGNKYGKRTKSSVGTWHCPGPGVCSSFRVRSKLKAIFIACSHLVKKKNIKVKAFVSRGFSIFLTVKPGSGNHPFHRITA